MNLLYFSFKTRFLSNKKSVLDLVCNVLPEQAYDLLGFETVIPHEDFVSAVEELEFIVGVV